MEPRRFAHGACAAGHSIKGSAAKNGGPRQHCLRCGRCCTRFGVCVTPSDIVRIAKCSGMKAEEFLSLVNDYAEREREEPAVLIDGRMKIVVLKRKKENFCCFYSGEGCKIYKWRPYLCRAYPFIFRIGKLVEAGSRACIRRWEPEGKEKGKYYRDAKIYAKQVEEYKKVAKEWNSAGGGDSHSFLKFALQRIKKR
ncbi:MAG: YkgJ family cysteine cluster protein [Candidatus Bilamarchaeaceae archaeon]